jgi:hypothetical protein
MDKSGRKRQRGYIEVCSVGGDHGASVGIYDDDGAHGDMLMRDIERRVGGATGVGNDDVSFRWGMTRARDYRGR